MKSSISITYFEVLVAILMTMGKDKIAFLNYDDEIKGGSDPLSIWSRV